MKAAVTTSSGNSEVIQIQQLPMPIAKPGWVLINVKAFGFNRSEMYTRQGHSPSVQFPIVQGIECVGVVAEDPDGLLEVGQQVAAIMGEMGRAYNGSYAEYCLVPRNIIIPFKSDLPWSTLGAIPEMLQTVSGSLHNALDINPNESILIRGGTSSIGLMSAQLAKVEGLTVLSTTRKIEKYDLLKENGADYVILETGSIHEDVLQIMPNGVNKVLELIGTKTLKDSLKCITHKGTVCMTGILGNEWTMESFTPMGDIPSCGKLTAYMGDSQDLSSSQLQSFLDKVSENKIRIPIDRVVSLNDVSMVHELMESNQTKGKVVCVI